MSPELRDQHAAGNRGEPASAPAADARRWKPPRRVKPPCSTTGRTRWSAQVAAAGWWTGSCYTCRDCGTNTGCS